MSDQMLIQAAAKAMRITPAEKDRKPDRHKDGTVSAINQDGSYQVVLDGSPESIKCRAMCTAMVGDRVSVCIRQDSMYDAMGRLGGDLGGGGSGGGGSSGFFTLEVDEEGDLYAIYEDGSTPPTFSLAENGDLYYIIRE